MNHARMTRTVLVGIAGVALCAGRVPAQMLADPAGHAEPGQFEIGGSSAMSAIAYEKKDTEGGDIDRILIGTYGAYGLTEYLNLYAGFGYAIESKMHSETDGDGYLFAGGLRSLVADLDPFSVHAHAELRYLDEDYGTGDGTISELVLGGTAKWSFTDAFGTYGGLELVPISDGDLETKDGREYDLERKTAASLKLGVLYDVGGVLLRLEASVLSEDAILLGASTRF